MFRKIKLLLIGILFFILILKFSLSSKGYINITQGCTHLPPKEGDWIIEKRDKCYINLPTAISGNIIVYGKLVIPSGSSIFFSKGGKIIVKEGGVLINNGTIGTAFCSNECNYGDLKCENKQVWECLPNGDADPCSEWVSIYSVECCSDLDCPTGYICNLLTHTCEAVCENECNNLGEVVYYCEGNSVYKKECNNFDEDPCLEWGNIKLVRSCSTGCYDSDNGLNYFQSGYVVDYLGCSNGGCINNTYYDYCSSENLVEYFCSENSYAYIIKNCNDFDNVTVDGNTCNWVDYSCINAKCSILSQNSVNCNNFDEVIVDTIKDCSVSTQSCTLGCYGESCCSCNFMKCNSSTEGSSYSLNGNTYYCVFNGSNYLWVLESQIPEEVCNDNHDNDLDGLVDCKDPDCIGKLGPNNRICCQSNNDCPSTYCTGGGFASDWSLPDPVGYIHKFYCNSTSNECFENVTTVDCNIYDSWLGGGNVEGCGDDPSSEYRDFYFNSSSCKCEYRVTQTKDCDSLDQCEWACKNSTTAYIRDYYVLENSDTCTYVEFYRDCTGCEDKDSTNPNNEKDPSFLTNSYVINYIGCHKGMCLNKTYEDYCLDKYILREYYCEGNSYSSYIDVNCSTFNGWYDINLNGLLEYWEYSCYLGYCKGSQVCENECNTEGCFIDVYPTLCMNNDEDPCLEEEVVECCSNEDCQKSYWYTDPSAPSECNQCFRKNYLTCIVIYECYNYSCTSNIVNVTCTNPHIPPPSPPPGTP